MSFAIVSENSEKHQKLEEKIEEIDLECKNVEENSPETVTDCQKPEIQEQVQIISNESLMQNVELNEENQEQEELKKENELLTIKDEVPNMIESELKESIEDVSESELEEIQKHSESISEDEQAAIKEISLKEEENESNKDFSKSTDEINFLLENDLESTQVEKIYDIQTQQEKETDNKLEVKLEDENEFLPESIEIVQILPVRSFEDELLEINEKIPEKAEGDLDRENSDSDSDDIQTQQEKETDNETLPESIEIVQKISVRSFEDELLEINEKIPEKAEGDLERENSDSEKEFETGLLTETQKISVTDLSENEQIVQKVEEQRQVESDLENEQIEVIEEIQINQETPSAIKPVELVEEIENLPTNDINEEIQTLPECYLGSLDADLIISSQKVSDAALEISSNEKAENKEESNLEIIKVELQEDTQQNFSQSKILTDEMIENLFLSEIDLESEKEELKKDKLEETHLDNENHETKESPQQNKINSNENLNSEILVIDKFEYHLEDQLDSNMNNLIDQDNLSSETSSEIVRHRSSSLQDNSNEILNDSYASLKFSGSTESPSTLSSFVPSGILSSPLDYNRVNINDLNEDEKSNTECLEKVVVSDTNEASEEDKLTIIDQDKASSDKSEFDDKVEENFYEKIEKLSENLKENQSQLSPEKSSLNDSSDSSDWLDVQKAINNYQKEIIEDEETNANSRNVEENKEVEQQLSPVVFASNPVKTNDDNKMLISSSCNNENNSNSSGESDNDEDKDDLNDQHRQSDNNKGDENKKLNTTVESVEEILIECKVDYRYRNEDDTDTSMSESVSTDSDCSERKNSEYDNINNNIHGGSSEDVNKSNNNDNLNDDINSVTSVESGNNQNNNNETLPSFTSITSNDICNNKSFDEDEFTDDFTDISKELDDNWIQDDDVWFGNSSHTSNITPKATVSMHPRMLHPIEEENSLINESLGESNNPNKSDNILSLEDDKNMQSTNPEDISVKETIENEKIEEYLKPEVSINISSDANSFESPLEDKDEFKVTLDYEIKMNDEEKANTNQNQTKINDFVASSQNVDDSDSNLTDGQVKEKLRTKQCDIDSLLGGCFTVTETNLFNETENVTENLDTSVDYKFVEENLNESYSILKDEEKSEEKGSRNNFLEISVEYQEETNGETIQQMKVQNTLKNIFSEIELQIKDCAINEDKQKAEKNLSLASGNQKGLNKEDISIKQAKETTEPATENDASDFEMEDNSLTIINKNEESSNKNSTYSEHMSEFSISLPNKDASSKSDDLNKTNPIESSTSRADQAKYNYDSQEDDDNETFELNKCIEDFNNELQQINDNIESNLEVQLTYSIKNKPDSSFELSGSDANSNNQAQVEQNFKETKNINNETLKKCESELDVSTLHLNLSESFKDETSSEKLKELISDIEKEIETDVSCSSSDLLTVKKCENFNDDKRKSIYDNNYEDTSSSVKYQESLINQVLSTEKPQNFDNHRKNDSIESNLTTAKYAGKIDTCKQDKCFQVNPIELSTNMIDIQTQMTPPVSPVKTNVFSKLPLTDAKHAPKTKVSVCIGTESEDSPKKVELKEDSSEISLQRNIVSQSISTQTIKLEKPFQAQIEPPKLEEKEKSEVANDIKDSINNKKDASTACSILRSSNSEVKAVETTKIDRELNDEQCLLILQDMKKMDDDIKSELSKINHQENKKNELFDMIKNYNILNNEEKAKVENILSSLKTENKNNNTIPIRKNIPIKNISLDTQVKEDESNIENIKLKTADTSSNSAIPKINVNQLPKSHFGNEDVPTSAILAAKLKQKNQTQQEFVINQPPPPHVQQRIPITNTDGKNIVQVKIENKTVVKETTTFPSNLSQSVNSIQSQVIQEPLSLSKPVPVNVTVCVPISVEQQQQSLLNNQYDSQFIDLLSLNLDRSKTWVEMTEAKLNYMIGETDAVLRSMCTDINPDEDMSKANDFSKKQNHQHLNINSNPTIIKCQHHQHTHPTSASCIHCGNHLLHKHQVPLPNTAEITSIEEMTKLYLDNYKRQLEESRKELNTKMTLLEKEKEKVSKIRDIRKREQYMRRQAAIEAFKLERERELSVSSSTKENVNYFQNAPTITSTASNYLGHTSYMDNTSVNEIDMDDTANDNYYRSSSSLNRSNLLNNQDNNNNEYDPDLNGSISRGRARKPSSQRYPNEPTLPSQNREKLIKLRRNLVINSNTAINNCDLMNLGNLSSNFDDYNENPTPRSVFTGSSTTLATTEPKYSSRVHSNQANSSRNLISHSNQYDPFLNLNDGRTRSSQSVTAPVERSSSRILNQQNTGKIYQFTFNFLDC
jgi:hypothetical protein